MNSMQHETEDRAFEAKARAAFEASVLRLDGASRSKLNQARQRALEAAARPRMRLPKLLMPAGALATAAALGLAVVMMLPVAAHRGPDAAALEDTDILTASEGIDLYSEDPEFFEWAASTQAGPATRDNG